MLTFFPLWVLQAEKLIFQRRYGKWVSRPVKSLGRLRLGLAGSVTWAWSLLILALFTWVSVGKDSTNSTPSSSLFPGSYGRPGGSGALLLHFLCIGNYQEFLFLFSCCCVLALLVLISGRESGGLVDSFSEPHPLTFHRDSLLHFF